MTTIVLVHGLWADGSAWSETIAELRSLGHEPISAQLPLESMEDDITAVRRILSTVDGPVLLVGWSYGGAVITNAAVGQDHVKALSYIAAFAPDEGESVSDIAHRNPGSLIREHIRVTADGHSYIDRPAYGKVIAADAPAERAALAAAVQKPPPRHRQCPLRFPRLAPDPLPLPHRHPGPGPARHHTAGTRRPDRRTDHRMGHRARPHVRPPQGPRHLPAHPRQGPVTAWFWPGQGPDVVPGRSGAMPTVGCPMPAGGGRGHASPPQAWEKFVPAPDRGPAMCLPVSPSGTSWASARFRGVNTEAGCRSWADAASPRRRASHPSAHSVTVTLEASPPGLLSEPFARAVRSGPGLLRTALSVEVSLAVATPCSSRRVPPPRASRSPPVPAVTAATASRTPTAQGPCAGWSS